MERKFTTFLILVDFYSLSFLYLIFRNKIILIRILTSSYKLHETKKQKQSVIHRSTICPHAIPTTQEKKLGDYKTSLDIPDTRPTPIFLESCLRSNPIFPNTTWGIQPGFHRETSWTIPCREIPVTAINRPNRRRTKFRENVEHEIRNEIQDSFVLEKQTHTFSKYLILDLSSSVQKSEKIFFLAQINTEFLPLLNHRESR